MKKSLLCVALLGSLGFVGSASALSASQTFTWTGTVPAAPTSAGVVIASPTGAAVNHGILTFTADAAHAGKGKLTGSTELSFNVFKEDAAKPGVADITKPATSYDFKLVNLAVNQSGLAMEQDANGYFAIQADNKGTQSKLVKNTAKTGAAGVTILSVVKSDVATPSNQPELGSSVDLQATILISNATV